MCKTKQFESVKIGFELNEIIVGRRKSSSASHSPSTLLHLVSLPLIPLFLQCWFNKFYCCSLNLKFIDSVRAASCFKRPFVLRNIVLTVLHLRFAQKCYKTIRRKRANWMVNYDEALRLDIIKNQRWPNGSKQRKNREKCAFVKEQCPGAQSSRLSPNGDRNWNGFHNWWAIKSCSPYLKTEKAISVSSSLFLCTQLLPVIWALLSFRWAAITFFMTFVNSGEWPSMSEINNDLLVTFFQSTELANYWKSLLAQANIAWSVWTEYFIMTKLNKLFIHFQQHAQRKFVRKISS